MGSPEQGQPASATPALTGTQGAALGHPFRAHLSLPVYLFITLLSPRFFPLPLFPVSGIDLSAGDTEVEGQGPPGSMAPFLRVLLSVLPAHPLCLPSPHPVLLPPAFLWLSPPSTCLSHSLSSPSPALCVLRLVFVSFICLYIRLLTATSVPPQAEGGLWGT